ISFIFCFWLLSQKDLKNNPIFDIAFFNLICAFLGARSFGIISTPAYYSAIDWSFLPLDYQANTYLFFNKNPWTFFRLDDGNLLYPGLLLGLFFGILLIYITSN